MSSAKTQKNQAIPLYYQLEISLRSRLANGEFVPGDNLPSEAEIGKKYNMSRITVRQALAALEREGLIRRQRGRGTFVTKRVKKLWTPKLRGSLEDAKYMGLTDKYEVKLINREEESASHHEAGLLGLGLGEKIHRIQRIRLYDGKPLAYMINLMPLDVGTGLSTKDLMSRPVLANLEVGLGLKLSEADQQIGATLSDAQIADMLNIRTGDPLLQMERTVFEEGGRAVNHASVLFRADRYSYKVKLRNTSRMGQRDWSLA